MTGCQWKCGWVHGPWKLYSDKMWESCIMRWGEALTET